MENFEQLVLEELSTIKSTSAATQARVEDLDKRLFNGGAGVVQNLQRQLDEIKDDHKFSDRVKTWLGPLMVTLHVVAHKLGWPL